jgi:nucleoside-diphosphate-sugar epimerase
MSRIAVVGGTSALAGRLIPVLRERHEVVTLGRGGCDMRCDLLDPVEAICLPEAADAVVHLAAAFGGPSDEDALRTVETNVTGTLKVCIAAKRAGVRHVVVLSSAYAAPAALPRHNDLHAITKRQADELAQDYCGRNALLLTVLRPAPLYGEEDAFRRHQPFFYHLADRAESGEDIELFGTRDARRNYLHADDMARVIREVLEKARGGTHICAFPRDVAMSEIAEAAQEAFGRGGGIAFAKDRPDQPDNVFGNSTELYEAIGFTPAIDVREGLRRLARSRGAAGP